jgi:hypothetical protein
MNQLSNCCKAQVSVDSSDEGISCFVCSGCKKPCDAICETDVPPVNYYFYLDGKVMVDTEEYDRLKRLDENAKKAIIHWRGVWWHAQKESEKALEFFNLLMSLYNE